MELIFALAAVFFVTVLKVVIQKRHGRFLGMKKKKARLRKDGQN
jgi:hypothetical protein